MINLGQVVSAVQKNCHISDARHAGNYTMCIFLLKMREYYRWEHDLPYSCRLPQEDVGNWLAEREQTWESLEADSYVPIPLTDNATNPFDIDTINRELVELGYVYSGGYGLFNKPHFFLASLLRKEEREGLTILVSSCEYARDLVAPPAMTRDNTVFVRQESVRRFLWEKVEEWQFSRRPPGPLARALAPFDADDNIDAALDRLTDIEIEIMILHEIGEVRAGHELGTEWEEMLSQIPRTRTELLVRAVRDNLADCLATLPDLLERNNATALHLFFSNFSGLRKTLFPQLLAAYETWATTGDTAVLQAVTERGASQWLSSAHEILKLYGSTGKRCGAAIEQLLHSNPSDSAKPAG